MFVHSPGFIKETQRESSSNQAVQHNTTNQQQGVFVLVHRTGGRGGAGLMEVPWLLSFPWPTVPMNLGGGASEGAQKGVVYLSGSCPFKYKQISKIMISDCLRMSPFKYAVCTRWGLARSDVKTFHVSKTTLHTMVIIWYL